MANHALNDYDAPTLDGQTCNRGLMRDASVRASSLLLFLFTLQMLVWNLEPLFFCSAFSIPLK